MSATEGGALHIERRLAPAERMLQKYIERWHFKKIRLPQYGMSIWHHRNAAVIR